MTSRSDRSASELSIPSSSDGNWHRLDLVDQYESISRNYSHHGDDDVDSDSDYSDSSVDSNDSDDGSDFNSSEDDEIIQRLLRGRVAFKDRDEIIDHLGTTSAGYVSDRLSVVRSVPDQGQAFEWLKYFIWFLLIGFHYNTISSLLSINARLTVTHAFRYTDFFFTGAHSLPHCINYLPC